MDLATVISTMFANFNDQFLLPIVSGLWGIIPNAATLAIIAAVLGVIVCVSPMQRGQKIASIIAIVVIAFAIPYIPAMLTSILSGGVADTGQLADSASAAASAAASSSSSAASTLSGLD